MKVKLHVPRVGPAGSFGVGDEIDVDDAEAQRMFAKDQASPVREPVKEKAIRKPKAERATK